VACGPSHADAGPWQLSQLTPSEISNARPRCSGVVESVWHAKHFPDSSALVPSLRMRAILSPPSLVSAWYARLCLSFKIQVVYSVCRIRLSTTGLTLPWQLVAAQEPGPMYFCASLEDFEFCAKAENANAKNAPAASAVRKSCLVEEFITENKKQSSRLYRSVSREVNVRSLSFSQRAPKSQRASIYSPRYGD
jgi:hypothetical protein